MALSYNISGVFSLVWGFDIGQKPPVREKKRQTSLGSNLWDINAKGIPYFLPVELDGIKLPNTLISISSKKRIIETPLIGRKGTVKELINIEDYEIMIRGVIVDEGISFPEEMIMNLEELYDKNEAVSLKCALTDIFLQEDDSVVIKSIRFPEMKGIEHAQAYEISCVSDMDFELIIE